MANFDYLNQPAPSILFIVIVIVIIIIIFIIFIIFIIYIIFIIFIIIVIIIIIFCQVVEKTSGSSNGAATSGLQASRILDATRIIQKITKPLTPPPLATSAVTTFSSIPTATSDATVGQPGVTARVLTRPASSVPVRSGQSPPSVSLPTTPPPTPSVPLAAASISESNPTVIHTSIDGGSLTTAANSVSAAGGSGLKTVKTTLVPRSITESAINSLLQQMTPEPPDSATINSTVKEKAQAMAALAVSSYEARAANEHVTVASRPPKSPVAAGLETSTPNNIASKVKIWLLKVMIFMVILFNYGNVDSLE